MGWSSARARTREAAFPDMLENGGTNQGILAKYQKKAPLSLLEVISKTQYKGKHPPSMSCSSFAPLFLPCPYHSLDDPVDGVAVNLQSVPLGDGIVVSVQLMRQVGDLPQALLVHLLTGGHSKQLDAHVSCPLSLHLHPPTGATCHMAVGDDHREVHTVGHLGLDLLGHVGDSTVRESAPAQVLDGRQPGQVNVFAACQRAVNFYHI